jgi:hypothetical protein
LRYRHCLDEFARYCMSPALSKSGDIFPICEIDEVMYSHPLALGDRDRGSYNLVLTGRGVGKTTRQKIRAFHGLLFGLRHVSLVVAATDAEARGWVDTIRGWCDEPPLSIQIMFPELKLFGNEHHIQIQTRFGHHHLLARSITGALRGLNVRTARPDAVDLDDVETEERSLSEHARDATDTRIRSKILPLVSLEGGAEVWWVQTPVHEDCVAARILKEPGPWQVCMLPVVRAWPSNSDLWAECRRIYFDVDAGGSRKGAQSLAESFYLEHKEQMDEGMVCLDPLRMGPWSAHTRRWDVGEYAWSREYEVRPSALGGGVLGVERWPRFRESEGVVRIGSHTYPISMGQITAHFDPSDGGDDGALVVVGFIQGRYYVLVSKVWVGAKLSQQIAELPQHLAPYAPLGLRKLSWEPPAGAASVVRDQIRKSIQNSALSIALEDWHSTENKNSRILSTLEPMGNADLIALPHNLPQRLLAQAAQWDPSRRDNPDDWLDALQRAIAYTGKKRGVSPLAARRAIRNVFGSR